jgi:hypothetical protein
MKPIVTTHRNPLLEDIKQLQAVKPEKFAGFIYLWKCMPEDSFYLGSHKGTPNDEYRGSGTMFRRVFEHYGMTQWERVIVEYVVDESQLKHREQYWIDKFRAVQSDRFYNQKNAVGR